MHIFINWFLISLCLLIGNHFAFADNTENSEKVELLTPVSEFEPLVADPRWPKFTVAYDYYIKGSYGRHIFSPNFGAVLPFVRNRSQNGTSYEWGIHAAVFSIMDVGSTPTRLINSDFFVGPVLVIQKEAWAYLFRVSHTSSHLGDEFLLSKQGRNVTRVNLSYEEIEGIFCYRFENGLRPYGGLAYLVDTDPKSYQTAEITGGFDFRPAKSLLNGYAKPIAGFHSKASKNSSWNPSLSVKGGLEFEDKIIIGKTLQVLFEYYYGNSIHGQFYTEVESYIGLGLNVNF